MKQKQIQYTSRKNGNTWTKTWSNPRKGWEFTIGYIGNVRQALDFRINSGNFRINIGRFFIYRMILPF